MTLRSRYVGIMLLTLATARCAHGVVEELPTAPGPAPVTITKLAITPVGGGSMLAGSSTEIRLSGPFPSTGAVLGAFAQYSDNSGQYVEAVWTSSDSSVLKVDGTTFSAISRGAVTITATAAGLSASETFTVEPNVSGTWSGRLIIDDCAAGSASANQVICDRNGGLLKAGTAVPVTFLITKNGPDLTAVAAFGELRGSLAGVDRGQNYLTLLGDLKEGKTTATVIHWDARARTDVMDGFVSFEVRVEGLPAWAALSAHFDGVTRR